MLPPSVLQTFQKVWGYSDFRPPQAEIIENLLCDRDSLVLLATGGGKSICFQLPAILKQGLTIVISPLLALMEDQVQDLQRRELPAATLHSNLTSRERHQVLQKLPHLRLLYVSPETLLSQPVWERLCAPTLAIAGIMVDEAHCLVQWGDTFRPTYRRLGSVRSALMQHKPPEHSRIAIAAFTATANSHAQAELISCLQLEQPQVIRTSPYRANLSLNVAIAWTPLCRKHQTVRFIHSQKGQTGLIYVRSRRETEELAEWLSTQSFHTAAYHAGLPSEQRRQIETAWIEGEYPFVVCTSAFGLGLNNPRTRWVLHFQAPLTLAEYIQEVGRAGRDGNPATALMLVSEPTGFLDNSDRNRQDFFLQQQQKQLQRAQMLLPKLPSKGNFSDVIKGNPDMALVLGMLHSAGKLVWHSPFAYEIRAGNHKFAEIDRTPLLQMQAYMSTRHCRWAFLMQAFGFEREAKTLRCGVCDRCLQQNKK
ncbi:RecQ family ATP-dependent DNA helicase [Tumidithrix elongata RA019]|uniref:ATP-dependent DNA helicase RecQ n=1 Tax=Tumidithrix elongata BACA0141 TaxID=2716417 RepID=A0AAW9Q084_9CYAN|nr:RecQ family ATP-dependent DNA helicase [Tumidithrix elongata RA019]